MTEIDVDALVADSATNIQKCGTCLWLDSRPDEERAKWVGYLEQPMSFPASQMSRAMAAAEKKDPRGMKVPGDGSIKNHRNHKR